MTKEIPLLFAKARARAARTRQDTKLPMPVRKGLAVKVKPNSKRAGALKKTGRSTTYQQQDSATEHGLSGPENSAGDWEGRNPGATQFIFEGDPGFEAAYQAGLRERRRRTQNARRAPPNLPQESPPRRRHATSPPSTRPSTPDTVSLDTVSDSELLGETEDQTPVAPTRQYDTATAPRVPRTLALPTDPPVPARPQRINAMTGLPFAGPNRRREALGGYGDNLPYRSDSPVRGSQVTQSPSIRITQDNNGRSEVMRQSSAASIGLPVAPANILPRSIYSHSPSGNYYAYDNGSETPTSASRPDPSSSYSRIPFNPNERAHRHAPIPAGGNAQPVGPPLSHRHAVLRHR